MFPGSVCRPDKFLICHTLLCCQKFVEFRLHGSILTCIGTFCCIIISYHIMAHAFLIFITILQYGILYCALMFYLIWNPNAIPHQVIVCVAYHTHDAI